MIDDCFLSLLKNKKNLLAFSHGSDSSALFFMLLKQDIDFDLALINYKTRLNSDLEEQSAKKLAQKYNKKIFIKIANKIEKNFEANARALRYKFFDEICKKYKYENLILAHNLNDKFEWFLMQFSKGAGFVELLGFKDIEKRKDYFVIRPLINISKNEILNFLKEENIKYFNDESNKDEKYFRNYIRINYANEFLSKFENGVKNTFKYLEKDLSFFDDSFKEFQGIYCIRKNESLISKIVKKFGVVMSSSQRKESLKGDCVISSKIGICYINDFVLIFKYETSEKMDKKFKEECRINKIPKLIRAYLYNHFISPKAILDSFEL